MTVQLDIVTRDELRQHPRQQAAIRIADLMKIVDPMG